MHRFALLLCLVAAAAGCATAKSYETSTETVESIPPAMARQAIQDLIANAPPPKLGLVEAHPVTDVVADDEGLGYSWKSRAGSDIKSGGTGPVLTRRYRWADLDPHLYEGSGFWFVTLEGEFGGSGLLDTSQYSPKAGCLQFASRADAEKFLDALAVMRSSVGAR